MSRRTRKVPAAAALLLLFPAAGVFLGASMTPGPSAASQRGSAAGMDRIEIDFQSEAERNDWQAVVQAQTDKARLAETFLARHPASLMATEAHYLIAVDAFSKQAMSRFDSHAEAALRGFPRLVETQPGQRIRWLSLLSQMAFVESETGRPESARKHASKLLALLDDSERPRGWTVQAWEQMARQLRASAHYALGRSMLAPGGDLSEAIARLEEAVRLDPLDGYGYYRLGQALIAADRPTKAKHNLARAALLEGAAAQAAAKQLSGLVSEQELPRLLKSQGEWLDRQLVTRPRALFALADGVPHPAFWLHNAPSRVREGGISGEGFPNIRRTDYAGPETCQTCHPLNYQAWATHSHRWMNAVADERSVKGDFDGAEIAYLGGRATFSQRGTDYTMRLERGRLLRSYSVTRTIGSRFFQYYVGRQVEGPESAGRTDLGVEEVLPFGYWLDRKEWVPVVHIDEELPDGHRRDPFLNPVPVAYDRNCSACHTTRPIGDWMLSTDGRLRLGAFAPHDLSFLFTGYLAEAHPRLYQSTPATRRWPSRRYQNLLVERIDTLSAPEHAVNLGVSCEACHNGARLHAERSTPRKTELKPRFFPSSPSIWIETSLPADKVFSRTPENLNWICSRCHSGGRPRYAGGMDTWNSTEASDAFRSACYQSERAEASGLPILTCVHCHDPHQSIGKKWSRSAEEDDGRCLSCHQNYREPEERRKHTRHPAESAGNRCMNCHMPRLNEGLQEMVRTHRIFSPTEPRMLRANQPNACNLCHLDKSTSWTQTHLDAWYGTSLSVNSGVETEGSDPRPAPLEWLAGPHPATRLAASDALTRGKATWALPALIEMLDDPYLINRQFTQRGIEEMLGVDLREFGYRFYQTPRDRRGPLNKIRRELGGE